MHKLDENLAIIFQLKKILKKEDLKRKTKTKQPTRQDKVYYAKATLIQAQPCKIHIKTNRDKNKMYKQKKVHNKQLQVIMFKIH